MIELTEEQVRALEAEEQPARFVNPATRETFVLIRQDVYELVRKILDVSNRRGWGQDGLLDS
jgi:hypothetical protein